MTEQRTGGIIEFIFSVLWAVVILLAGRCIIYFLPSYKSFGTVITIIMFCILGFFVMTRYAAVFTYTLKGYCLRVNRTIGKRNKEIEIKISDIKSISRTKPSVMPSRRNVYIMCTSVFSKKDLYYIEYTRRGVGEVLVFEPSGKMVKQIKTLKKSEGSNKI